MSDVKLSAPWIQYVNAVKALFEKDKEVDVVYDDDANLLKLFVEESSKAEALSELLPTEKNFAGVTLKINVIPANTKESAAMKFAKAFRGNPILKDTLTISEAFSNPLTYFIFAKEVVQYYNDDLSDPHGLRSTLWQVVANDVFDDHDGVIFCTDSENLGKPLGEWP